MNKSTQHYLFTAAIIGGLLATSSAAQASYSFATADFPGSNLTYANGINNGGQTVGQWLDTSGTTHGFYGSATIDYGTDQYGHTSFQAINNNGQSAGYYSDNTGTFGFARNVDGSTIQLNDTNKTHGANYIATQAYGLNNLGDVVGQYNTANGYFSFSYNTVSKIYTDIGEDSNALTGNTLALGINDQGWIVGNYSDSTTSKQEGFLKIGGVWTTIDDANANAFGTTVTGVNDKGQVVGWYYDNGWNQHGFIYDGNLKSFVNDNLVAGGSAISTGIFGINDNGQLVGQQQDANGVQHAFIATAAPVSAVPLPGAVWLFGSVLMAGLYSSKRKGMLAA